MTFEQWWEKKQLAGIYSSSQEAQKELLFNIGF